jgi:hypothetical protein
MSNNLIIGAGPVGLFTALLLKDKEPNCKITILESRHSFTRKQVLLINEANFKELARLGVSKDIFAKIERPRKSINGILCKSNNLTCVDKPNVYSVQINILQETMFNLIEPKSNVNTTTYIPGNNTYSIRNRRYNSALKKLLLNKQKSNKSQLNSLEIELNNYNNIFLCTGQKDQLSTLFTQTYKPSLKEDIYNPEGCIVFIKPKNNNTKNQLIINKISKESEILQTLNFEDRYRLFFSPTILTDKNNINIYMGIQLSYIELEEIKKIIGPLNNDTEFKKYIKKCVIIALENYYKEFNYSENNYDINITEHFPIKLKFNERNVMQLNGTNTKLFLMGDGKFGVNFFSGTGVNYGLSHASIVIKFINESFSNIDDLEQKIKDALTNAKITKEDLFNSSVDVSLFDSGKDVEYVSKIILPDLEKQTERNSFNLINKLVTLYNNSQDQTMKLALKSFILSFTYIRDYSITFKIDKTLSNYNNKIVNNIFKNCKTNIKLITKNEITKFKIYSTVPNKFNKETFELLNNFINLLNILNNFDISKKKLIHKILSNILNKSHISDFELQIILSIVERIKELYRENKDLIFVNTLIFIIDKIILFQRKNSVNINKKIILDMAKSVDIKLKNYADLI